MSYPASATELGQQARLSELIAAGSLEISPREPGNVAGVHLYSFGGAVRTATWMRELIAG